MQASADFTKLKEQVESADQRIRAVGCEGRERAEGYGR